MGLNKAKGNITYKTRITLRVDGDFEGHGFGKGIDMLLSGIDEYGSLNRAAKELGMAYSKAWRVLRLTEEEFGLQLIDRNGAHGSAITQEGREFLDHYREMVQAADDAAGQVI